MSWLEITVPTPQGDLNTVASALTARGFSDLVLEDQGEFEAFLEENRSCWDYIDEELQQKLQGLSQIKLYLEDSDQAGMEHLKAVLAQLRLTMTAEALPDTDWEESWKDNYPPQEVGQSLVVVPCWLDAEYPGRIPVILDPGLTFGTGAHPSTRMVMEFMERIVKPGFRCLDLGSGSGILSITALRLGASAAVGVDIDPKAEDAARENAGYNGFTAPEFTALTGDVTADPKLMAALRETEYDLVLVNIVADVIIRLSALLPAFLRSGGELLCSGILDSRLEDVTAALENAGIQILETKAEAEWRSLRARLAASGTRSIGV